MIQIRLATEHDKEEILQLYHSLIGTPGCTWNEDYPAIEDIESDLAKQSLYVLYRTGYPDLILAAAAAGEDDELNALSCWSKDIHHPCDLARIGVRREFQNRGLAGKLIRYIEQEALKKGFDGIHFLVSKTNPAALTLYQKLNYHPCGEAMMYGINWWCYEKKLG